MAKAIALILLVSVALNCSASELCTPADDSTPESFAAAVPDIDASEFLQNEVKVQQKTIATNAVAKKTAPSAIQATKGSRSSTWDKQNKMFHEQSRMTDAKNKIIEQKSKSMKSLKDQQAIDKLQSDIATLQGLLVVKRAKLNELLTEKRKGEEALRARLEARLDAEEDEKEQQTAAQEMALLEGDTEGALEDQAAEARMLSEAGTKGIVTLGGLTSERQVGNFTRHSSGRRRRRYNVNRYLGFTHSEAQEFRSWVNANYRSKGKYANGAREYLKGRKPEIDYWSIFETNGGALLDLQYYSGIHMDTSKDNWNLVAIGCVDPA